MITRLPGVLSLLGLAFSLFACGGAAKPASTPEGDAAAPAVAPAADEAPAVDKDAMKAQLEADLARAEDELAAAIPPPGGQAKKTDAQDRADRAARPAATAVSPAQPATPMAAGGAEQAPPGAGTTCERVCRAYTSMQNAAGQLCELAGQDDDRCGAAKKRLARAQDRLQASCPMCEASSK